MQKHHPDEICRPQYFVKKIRVKRRKKLHFTRIFKSIIWLKYAGNLSDSG